MATKHTATAAHRPRLAPDRLGPLEIAIGVLVLAVALSLVLVSRSVASRTTAAAPAPVVRVSGVPGPVARHLAPEDARSERTADGGVV